MKQKKYSALPKRLSSVCLAVLLCLSIACLAVLPSCEGKDPGRKDPQTSPYLAEGDLNEAIHWTLSIEGTLTVSGDVKLILKDGSQLTAQGGENEAHRRTALRRIRHAQI